MQLERRAQNARPQTLKKLAMLNLHRVLHIFLLTFIVANHAHFANAQSLQVPGKMPRGTIVITNVTVHPVSSDPIEHGYIAFKNGIITSIGSSTYSGNADQTVDGRNQHVYPGLISAYTQIGLTEIGAVRATNDGRETGQFTPEVAALTAVNPDSAIIPVTRSNGILTALTAPSGGRISGFASIINLDGWTTEDLGIRKNAGLVLNWPSMQPGSNIRTKSARSDFFENVESQMKELNAFFDSAGQYAASRQMLDSEQEYDLRLESLVPVLQGDVPVFVHVRSATQIRAAIAWCTDRQLKMIVVGAQGIERCLDILRSKDVPVIVTGIHRMPRRRDSAFDQAFMLPKILDDAGVQYCIASGTGGASNERNLPYHAATAAAYGLDADRAMRAITLQPAQILGLGDQLGSLESGKRANIILTTGNPLEITTLTLAAWIDGAPVDLGDKQKSLNEKYRQRYNLPRP